MFVRTFVGQIYLDIFCESTNSNIFYGALNFSFLAQFYLNCFPFVFAISLCSYEVTLTITAFGHWQGSRSLCEYYVSSWIIPTEFHRCLVMCRWAWLGCMAGISLPIAVGDIVSVHTKALLHVLSVRLSVRYFYSTLFHERTLSWTLGAMPGLLPEVWSCFLSFKIFTIIIAVLLIYVISSVWVPVSSSPTLFQFVLQAHIRQ